jgi:hypothetical protein
MKQKMTNVHRVNANVAFSLAIRARGTLSVDAWRFQRSGKGTCLGRWSFHLTHLTGIVMCFVKKNERNEARFDARESVLALPRQFSNLWSV